MTDKLKCNGPFLSKAEIGTLIQVPTNFRDRCIIKLIVKTDILRYELCNLDIENINFKQNKINILGSKPRTIECPPDLMADLKTHIGTRSSGPLFLSNRNKQISPRQVNYIVEDIGRKAGIKNPNPKHKHINLSSFGNSNQKKLTLTSN